MPLKQKLKNTVEQIRCFWTFRLPGILVFVALVIIIIVSGKDFYSSGDYTQTLVIYISVIGVSIAMASTAFTYAQCYPEPKKKLIKAGQLFFYSSILMIMALLIGWLSFKTKGVIENLPWKTALNIIANFIFVWNIAFLIFAINAFHVGLTKLERHFWNEVREDIK